MNKLYFASIKLQSCKRGYFYIFDRSLQSFLHRGRSGGSIGNRSSYSMSYSTNSGIVGGGGSAAASAESQNPNTNNDWRRGSVRKNGKYLLTWLYDDGIWKAPSLSTIWNWQKSRVLPALPCPGDFPVWRPDWAKINAERSDNNSKSSRSSSSSTVDGGGGGGGVTSDTAPAQLNDSCTWLGHATCLLLIADVGILTDPVFSRRCSPVQFAGPTRYTPPACSIDQLPPIHMVHMFICSYVHMFICTDLMGIYIIITSCIYIYIYTYGNDRIFI